MTYFFTSESVTVGHPDKVADQIADAVLDACLTNDPNSKVACEVMLTTGIVLLAGEITTSKNHVDYEAIARNVIKKIGYDDPVIGFDYCSCGVLTTIHKQSPDIAQGVLEGEGLHKEEGAGDQGIMFGYACDETPELMPLPIMLAHRLTNALKEKRESKEIPYLRPDGKAQVTVKYSKEHVPIGIHSVVVSAQHKEEADYETIVKDITAMIKEVLPNDLLHDDTKFFINPTGRFVLGGPAADTGLTGRKSIVDTYGGMGKHGGGSFSGKDPSKVDRSATYAARYIAKNIVAAKIAKRCEIQISYAIGVAKPLSVKVETFETGIIDDDKLSKIVEEIFDLTPKGIVTMLDLKKPIYFHTSYGGHFGRESFRWEKTDKKEELLKAVKA